MTILSFSDHLTDVSSHVLLLLFRRTKKIILPPKFTLFFLQKRLFPNNDVLFKRTKQKQQHIFTHINKQLYLVKQVSSASGRLQKLCRPINKYYVVLFYLFWEGGDKQQINWVSAIRHQSLRIQGGVRVFHSGYDVKVSEMQG